jgi:GT2 family glycosyltransferase/glycosyltransferase involved in cell wall biosynthesis
VIAEQHAAKIAEMAQFRAEVAEAFAAFRSRPDAPPSRLARVGGLVRDPGRIVPAIDHRLRQMRARIASVPQAVVREGGVRPTGRRALGLLLRDGFKGVPPLFPVSPVQPRKRPAPVEPVRPAWYSATAPEVSIVVLNWNRADVTLECLESLWEHTTGHPYEIVLVDNGSRPSEVEQFDHLRGPCRVVRLELNRYFGEGNNIGVERARAPYVVLMNNDVTVTAGWLEPLLRTLRDNPDAGVVGPKFLYPNGLLQEAGALLDEEGRSVQIGKFGDPSAPEYNRGRVVDYISAACCLLRKVDFVDVLGFDMRYEPAYYEDSDLCLRLNQLGLKTYYVPESKVIHRESVTTSDSSHGLRLSSISELNRMKFRARWDQYLSTGVHSDVPALNPVIQPSTKPGRRSLAVYSPFELTPGGGERYLLTLAEVGLQHGLNVHFVSPAPYSRMRMTAVGSMLGLDLNGLVINSLGEAQELAPFDDWVVMSNQLVPPTRGLGVRNTLHCQFPFLSGRDQWQARRAWLTDYSRFVVNSPFTAENVLRRLSEAREPELPIVILSPPVDVTDVPIHPNKSGIVSTGRFFSGDHSKRQDLQIEAFRRLTALRPDDDLVLHLVGSSATQPAHRKFLADCMTAAEGLAVQFHVDAPLSEVNELYASSSLYWHSSGLNVDVALEPERCEHFGIAPIEAMGYGTIPLVVDNGGPADTVRPGIDGYHYSTVDELVARTDDLLNRSEDELRPMREATRARANDFSRAHFAAAAAELFDM